MGRRNLGEGSLYQSKTDGYWVAQYNGTYRYSKDKKAARRKLVQMMQKSEEATPKNITVSKVLDNYLQSAKQNLKPRTAKRYCEAVEMHLRPALGKAKLHKLTALDVEDVYARTLQGGLSATTIQLINAVLSPALKRAVRLRLAQTNVCRDGGFSPWPSLLYIAPSVRVNSA